jgi:predicted nucleic acid-binding protein
MTAKPMLPAPAFLDTNILLRHVLQDLPHQSPRATALIGRIEAGEVRVRLTETVVFETVFSLQRTYKRRPQAIREALLPILELPGISLPRKARFRKAFALYVDENLPFADAYHAALMGDLGLREIYSFDEDFDRIPGITRLEP